jgi:hypothetical protein
MTTSFCRDFAKSANKLTPSITSAVAQAVSTPAFVCLVAISTNFSNNG